jgi:hypothetical protein
LGTSGSGGVGADDRAWDDTIHGTFIELTWPAVRRIQYFLFKRFNTSTNQTWNEIELTIGEESFTVDLSGIVSNTVTRTIENGDFTTYQLTDTITFRQTEPAVGSPGLLFLVTEVQVGYCSAETAHDPQYNSTDYWAAQSRVNNVQFSDASTPDADSTTYSAIHSYEFTRAGDGSPISLRFADAGSYADNQYSWTVKVYEVDGGPTYGDAFYEWSDNQAATAYEAGYGFKIDSSTPSKPPYNSQHDYDVEAVGTGSPVVFEYDDPDNDYTDNENANLIVTVCGTGAK